MAKKKKMNDLTKCKLIYSGELLFFALLAITLGVLFVIAIIKVSDWKKWLFTIITLGGGIWAITDFVWTLKSEKKRKKNCLLDKIILLPNAAALIGLDIYALVNLIKDNSWTGNNGVPFFQYVIGGALIYVGVVFLFEAIYHWFVIHPLVIEAAEEEKVKEAQSDAISNEENKEE